MPDPVEKSEDSSDVVVIVSGESLAWVTHAHGERFEARRKQLGVRGEQLGCSLYEVPPGKAAWPLHAHLANEEAIYVLSGAGTLRLGSGESARELALVAGDYVALLRGVQHAHQLLNTSDETLRYLCFSTQHEPDVTIYPDTQKVGIFAGAAPGGPKARRTYAAYLDQRVERGYWDDEL